MTFRLILSIMYRNGTLVKGSAGLKLVSDIRMVFLEYDYSCTVHHLLGFLFDNLDYDCKWLKIDCFGSTLCVLLDFDQNKLVKIGHLQLN